MNRIIVALALLVGASPALAQLPTITKPSTVGVQANSGTTYRAPTINISAAGATLACSAGICTFTMPAWLTGVSVSAGLTGNGTAGSPLTITYGTGANTTTQGNDTRLAPAPTAAGKLIYDTSTGYAEGAACTTSQVVVGGGAGPYSCGQVPAAAIPNTTVSAASYTYTSLTVGADGRLTAASSGAAPTPATVYTNGASTTDSVMTENSTNGPLTCNYSAIASTTTVGLSLANTTAATSGAKEQDSPALQYTGTSWNGAISKTVKWVVSAIAYATSTAGSDLVAQEDTGGGTLAERWRWLSGGATLKAAGQLTLESAIADGTTAGNVINCVNSFGATHYCLELQNGGTAYVRMDGSGNLRLNVAGNGAGLVNTGNTFAFYPKAGGWSIYNTALIPDADLNSANTLGSSSARWYAVYSRHYLEPSSAPSHAESTGAGTSPTVTVAGDDSYGSISITAGSSAASGNATVTTLTFNTAFPNHSYCVCSPSNNNDVLTQTYCTSTTTTLVVVGPSALGLSNGQVYTLTYACGGN